METKENQSLPQISASPDNSRFSRILEMSTRIVAHKPKIEGLENLENFQNGHVIFATSHLSDTDPTIATVALSKYRLLDIASLETNQKAFRLRALMGDRFHDVKNTFTDEPHTSFDTSNFEDMAAAIRNGKDIVIAAHKPVRDWQLPDNAGVGDVYLSHLTDSPIIPVAVDIHSEKQVGMSSDVVGTIRRALSGKRPEVTVRLGKAIKFEQMDRKDLEDVGMILMGKRDELRLDPNRYQNALENYKKMREQADAVVSSIAEMFPQEKRGKWPQSPIVDK